MKKNIYIKTLEMTLNTETLELSDSVNSEVDDSKMSILKLSKREML